MMESCLKCIKRNYLVICNLYVLLLSVFRFQAQVVCINLPKKYFLIYTGRTPSFPLESMNSHSIDNIQFYYN